MPALNIICLAQKRNRSHKKAQKHKVSFLFVTYLPFRGYNPKLT